MKLGNVALFTLAILFCIFVQATSRPEDWGPFYLNKSSKSVQVALTIPCAYCRAEDKFEITADTKEFDVKKIKFISITGEYGSELAEPFEVSLSSKPTSFSIPFERNLHPQATVVLIAVLEVSSVSSFSRETIDLVHKDKDVKYTIILQVAEPVAASAIGTAVTTFTKKDEKRTRRFTVNISQAAAESQGLLLRFHGSTDVLVGPEECNMNGLSSYRVFIHHDHNLKTQLFYFHRDETKPEAKLASGLDITVSCTHMVEFLVPQASVTIALIPLDHIREKVYEPTHAITVPVTMSRVDEIPKILAHSFTTVNSFSMRVAFAQTGAYDPRDYFTIRILNAKGVESINLHTSQIDTDTGRATILKHYNGVTLSQNTTGKLTLGDIGFKADKEQVLAFTIVLELKEFAIDKTPLQGTIEFSQHVSRDVVPHLQTVTPYVLPPFAKSMKFDITKKENSHSAQFKVDIKQLTKGILSKNDSIEISTTNYEYFFDAQGGQDPVCTINGKKMIQKTEDFPSDSVFFDLTEDVEDVDAVIDCPHLRFVTHKDASKDTKAARNSVIVSHFLKGQDVPFRALVDYVQLNEKSSSSFPVWGILLVIVVVLAIVGGVIAFVVRRRNKGSGEETEGLIQH